MENTIEYKVNDGVERLNIRRLIIKNLKDMIKEEDTLNDILNLTLKEIKNEYFKELNEDEEFETVYEDKDEFYNEMLLNLEDVVYIIEKVLNRQVKNSNLLKTEFETSTQVIATVKFKANDYILFNVKISKPNNYIYITPPYNPYK